MPWIYDEICFQEHISSKHFSLNKYQMVQLYKKYFYIWFICFQLTLVGLLYFTFQHIYSQLVISAHNLFQ